MKSFRVGPFASGFGWLMCWIGLHKAETAYGHVTCQGSPELDGYYAQTDCLRCGLVLKGGPSAPTKEKR